MHKNIRSILFAGVAALAVSACGADNIASPGDGSVVIDIDNPPAPPPPPPPPTAELQPAASCPSLGAGTSLTLEDRGLIQVRNRGSLRNCGFPTNAVITDNVSVTAAPGVIYSFEGQLAVGVDVGGDGSAVDGDPGELSIDEGVVMFARSTTSAILVNRGSKLNVAGEADNPVVITGQSNVTGNITQGVPLAQDSVRQWGGLLILGRGAISECGTTPGCEATAEGPGISALYGGNAPGLSSGTISYLQLRFTGLGAGGNELQGITTGGVEDQTTIEYVHIHQSSDDGIEAFGGNHNAKRLVITGIGDDSLDLDRGWQGAIQFALVKPREDADYLTEDPRIMEIDSGGVVDSLPRTSGKIANFTFIAPNEFQKILVRGGADFEFYNGVIDTLGKANSVCLDIDQKAGADTGSPIEFDSVIGNCAIPFDADDDTQESDQFTSSPNSSLELTFSLNGFLPSTDADFVNANNNANMDLNGVDAFFTDADFIGAVRDANDTWYQSWTCDSDILVLGSGNSCLDVPAVSA